MPGSRVVYNGMEMDADWPRRIQAAQSVGTYVISGTAYPRIPYGREEGGRFPEPCHDCGVLLGQYHVELVCDMEQCPLCGGQVIGCHCPYADDAEATVGSEVRGQNVSVIDWQGLRTRIGSEIGGYTVLLETKDGRHVPPDDAASGEQPQDVVALAITWIQDGVAAWDTEGPARQLAARLSQRCGLSPIVLLNRSVESFVGFYVRITG